MVTVRNYGDRSILDVTYENVAAEEFPSARFTPQLRWVNVIEPNRDNPNGTVFQVRAADERLSRSVNTPTRTRRRIQARQSVVLSA
jgi:hypothetical protein